MTGGDSMDVISLDDWELLPDQESSFFMEECTVGGKDQILLGSNLVMISTDYFTPGPASHPSPYDCILDEEAKRPHQPPLEDSCAQDPVVEFKDIGVVETESTRGEFLPKVSEVLISDAEEEEEMVKSPTGGEEVCEEDEVMVEAAPDVGDDVEGVKGDRAGLECVGFSVGKLRVNGVGALCSFGVAAATFCILLLGGKPQNQHQKRIQSQKIQFQMYADDEFDLQRIQQAVEQASMLNQAMSSVMGGASTRASISFGGYYDGF